jgi:hypothetical protein
MYTFLPTSEVVLVISLGSGMMDLRVGLISERVLLGDDDVYLITNEACLKIALHRNQPK